MAKETTHRFSANSFKLHRLPVPRPGVVLGLVGTNGIGKSTALKILAGKQKPNLGRFDIAPDWTDILAYFRGSELQNYFTKCTQIQLFNGSKPVLIADFNDFNIQIYLSDSDLVRRIQLMCNMYLR